MVDLLDPSDAVDHFIAWFNAQLSAQIKLLLEEKHLYQKVKIEGIQEVRDGFVRRVAPPAQAWVNDRLTSQLNRTLSLSIDGYPTRVNIMEGGPKLNVCLLFPTVRLFCLRCERKEPFGPVWYQDAVNEMLKPGRDGNIGRNFDLSSVRLYFIAYQCQYCKGAPEGFLIRKAGWAFSLDGRSPMEEIQLPAFIPKKEQRLYGEAVIAGNAGKRLAAVFYLRCFIEKFARRQTGMQTQRATGDQIMDAYAKRLPEKQRDSMPSLKEWYDKLSEPIHAADEDAAEAIFEPARQATEKHFDLRGVLEIPDTEGMQARPEATSSQP